MLKCPNCVWYKSFALLGRSGCNHEKHLKGVTRDCEDFADKKKYRLVSRQIANEKQG